MAEPYYWSDAIASRNLLILLRVHARKTLSSAWEIVAYFCSCSQHLCWLLDDDLCINTRRIKIANDFEMVECDQLWFIRLIHSPAISYTLFSHSHSRLLASVSPFFVLPVIRQMIKRLYYANKGKWWMTLEHLLQILYYVQCCCVCFFPSANDDAWEMVVWRIDVICQIDEFHIMNFCKTLFSFKFTRRNCFDITSNSNFHFDSNRY